MTLVDLRKLSIRRHLQIRFQIRGGRECVITEKGIAEVPGVKGVPDFNLEEELAAAGEFLLESVAAPAGKREVRRQEAPRRIPREELIRMAGSGTAAAGHAEHEEE